MTQAEIEAKARELANWHEFCRCTSENQMDRRCDGVVCAAQMDAIAECLRAITLSPHNPSGAA